MPPVSAPELLVLHALRLKGAADAEAVARRFPVPVATATALLDAFVARAWARVVEFAGGGLMLTPAGRAEGSRRLAAELESTGARPAVEGARAAFDPLNGRFLRTCTDWQLRSAPSAPGSPAAGRLVPNDHGDAAWDARVLDELRAVHEAVGPVCDELAAALARFAGYRERFVTALARVEAGDREWFDRPVMDSYHTVWFELHEDLLATLGLERGVAAPAEGADDPTAERES